MGGLLRRKQEKTGSELIYHVIGQFDSMIASLQKGMDHCHSQRTDIAEQIKTLQDTDGVLSQDITRAQTVKERLQNLIEPAKTE